MISYVKYNQLLLYDKAQLNDHSYIVKDKRSNSDPCLIIAYDVLKSKTIEVIVRNYAQKI